MRHSRRASRWKSRTRTERLDTALISISALPNDEGETGIYPRLEKLTVATETHWALSDLSHYPSLPSLAAVRQTLRVPAHDETSYGMFRLTFCLWIVANNVRGGRSKHYHKHLISQVLPCCAQQTCILTFTGVFGGARSGAGMCSKCVCATRQSAGQRVGAQLNNKLANAFLSKEKYE